MFVVVVFVYKKKTQHDNKKHSEPGSTSNVKPILPLQTL